MAVHTTAGPVASETGQNNGPLNKGHSTTAPPVKVTVGAKISISGLTPHAQSDVIDASMVPKSAHAHKTRLGLWTGATAPVLRTWPRTPHGIIVPFGAFSLVVGICRKHGLVDDIVDVLVPALEAVHRQRERALGLGTFA